MCLLRARLKFLMPSLLPLLIKSSVLRHTATATPPISLSFDHFDASIKDSRGLAKTSVRLLKDEFDQNSNPVAPRLLADPYPPSFSLYPTNPASCPFRRNGESRAIRDDTYLRVVQSPQSDSSSSSRSAESPMSVQVDPMAASMVAAALSGTYPTLLPQWCLPPREAPLVGVQAHQDSSAAADQPLDLSAKPRNSQVSLRPLVLSRVEIRTLSRLFFHRFSVSLKSFLGYLFHDSIKDRTTENGRE